MISKLRHIRNSMKLNWKFTIVMIIALVIPIAIFAGVLFYNIEQNTISENKNYMEYKIDRNMSQISTCIDSVNMSTQFFLSDKDLGDVLMLAALNEPISTAELVEFQESDITNLERLVSNNPLLYSVRVFAENDNVQEMMPILYNHDRMTRLSWANENEILGWHFGYNDTAFSALISSQSQDLVGLVSSISDYRVGVSGYIEASMPMENMFPGMYEDIGSEWSCLVLDDGSVCYGSNKRDDSESLLDSIMATYPIESANKTEIYYTNVHGRKLVVGYLPVSELDCTLIAVNDITDDIMHVYKMRNIFIVLMIILLIGLAFFINYIVRRMLRQFYSILRSMRMVQAGNLDVRIEHCSDDEMGELGNQLNIMLDKIQKIMDENINREVLVKNSEIRALQNQINAHFIYNVLESIKMMAEIDEEYEISDSITSLGKLLRYSMKWVSGNVKVSEELEYIRNYMALINLRYDFEVHLSVNIPENLLDQEIPKMSLQPIVENAILHGIEPLGEDSTIYIKGHVEEGDSVIEITDAGGGMTEEELKKLIDKIYGQVETTGGKGNGIGLKNVHDRIRMAFGKKYGLTISSKENCFTKVAIRLPRKKG